MPLLQPEARACAQANATKMQLRLQSPVSAAAKAADLVEHVIRTGKPQRTLEHPCAASAAQQIKLSCELTALILHAGGEHYLRTREGELTWWQLQLLDVYAVLLAAGTAVLGLAAGVLLLLLRGCSWLLQRQRGKAKVQ